MDDYTTIFQKTYNGKRLSANNHCNKVIYIVSNSADHPRYSPNPDSIISQAGVHRSAYIFNIIVKHFVKSNIYRLSFASQDTMFRTTEYPNESYDNVTEVHLGQTGLGLFRHISSTLFAIVWFMKHLGDEDIVVIYNFTPPIAVFVWFTMLFRKYKLIVEFEELYGLIGTSRYKKLFLISENYGIQKGTGFIVCSEKIAKHIRSSRSQTPPIAVSSGYFGSLTHPTTQLRNGTRLNVLYSGTLDDRRGVTRLIDTMVGLEDIANLIITGTGPLKDYVANKAQLRENIRYLGVLPENMYQQILAEADICINPTPPNTAFSQYSFPSKITYYLSHSKIVVSTRLDVIQTSPYRDMIIYYDDAKPENLRETLIYIRDHFESLSERSKIFLKEISVIQMREKNEIYHLFKSVCN